MRFLPLTLLCFAFSTLAQDYAREARWAAEVVPNLVVGDAVRIALPTRNFLGLYTEAKPAKAAILLVHGLGVHPDHGVIGILRASLADLGYATLSIQMPVQHAQATAGDYPKLFPEAAARIEAGARWLEAKGHRRLMLLSHSMGSRMAMAYYERTAAAPFSAWVSLGITADYGDPGKVTAPVLDVVGENDFPQVLEANPRRRLSLSGVSGSKQQTIPQADHYYTGREKELAAAIREFLEVPAAGARRPECPEVDAGAQQAREKECRAGGGEWSKFGIRAHLCGVYSCAPRTADGGKPCRNRSECEYLCVYRKAAAMGTAVTGECAAVRSPFGCNSQVDGGKIIGYVCVD